jgi:hypothetical protein
MRTDTDTRIDSKQSTPTTTIEVLLVSVILLYSIFGIKWETSRDRGVTFFQTQVISSLARRTFLRFLAVPTK